MTPLLKLTELVVRYGAVTALKGIDLEVDAGEIVTLLGANGAGKTTTLRAVSRLTPMTKGSITFDGHELAHLHPHEIVALGVSHVPEGRRIFPQMSVAENLEMGAYRHRANRAEGFEQVFGLFPVLAERRRQMGGTLSGGEQQMLAIGRALMSRPRILLLDEPSMGLAPMFVQRIFEIIAAIREQGITVLVVEQNAVQALLLADRGYVLETGTIVMSGAADDLTKDDQIRAAYLGESLS